MRKRPFHIALLIASAYPLGPFAFADVAWQGSYSANGQCFCSGEVTAAFASRIVPTPIGGQTIKQVCDRVGEGPVLKNDAGFFNHPVYKDPQCGHGPHAVSSRQIDEGCTGSLDGKSEHCVPTGPQWDLNRAYGVEVKIAAALPATSSSADSSDFLSLDRGASLEVGDDTANTEADAVVTTEEEREAVLENFAGKSVTVGGERYFQARKDMNPVGGAVGSRIILDGVVYLKDDENLVIADLYKEEETAEPVQQASSAESSKSDVEEPVKQAPAKATKAAEASKAEADRAAQRLAQRKKEQAQREAQARADYEKEQSARMARLQERRKIAREQAQAQSKKIAEQKRLAALKDAEEKQQLAEQKRLAALEDAEKKKQIEEQKSVEKKRLENEALAAQKANNEAEKATNSQASKQVDAQVGEPSSVKSSAASSALRLPLGVRASSREFSYMEAMPASYDIGGSGIILEGSGQGMSRFQWLGRLGVADTYREVMVGGGYYFTPANADRMTIVLLAGLENGSFELSDELRAPGLIVNYADTGLYVGALSRIVINSRFELKTGLGYSSFFEGDATLFGGGYFHVTPRLDIMSRFEIGDNDSVGVGIRYYY